MTRPWSFPAGRHAWQNTIVDAVVVSSRNTRDPCYGESHPNAKNQNRENLVHVMYTLDQMIIPMGYGCMTEYYCEAQMGFQGVLGSSLVEYIVSIGQ